MKVNLHMIASAMGDLILGARFTKDRSSRAISRPGLLPDGGTIDGETIYVVPIGATINPSTFSRWRKHSSRMPSFALLDPAQEEELPASAEYLLLGTKDAAKALDRLVEVFNRYDAWEADLMRAALEGAPLSELGAIAERMLGKPIILYDRFFQTLFYAHAGDAKNVLPQRDVNDAIPDWELAEVRAESEFFEVREPYSSERFREQFGYSHLCYNLFSGDERIGVLAIHESERALEDRDWGLIAFLGDFLACVMMGSAERGVSVSGQLNFLLNEMASGSQVPRDELERALADIGWGVEGDYVCISLVDESSTRGMRALRRTANAVTNAVSGIAAVVRDGAITFACNTARNPAPVPDIVSAIAACAKGHGGFDSIGVSGHFELLSDFGMFRKHSIDAINVGRRYGDRGPIHYFDERLVEQLLLASMADLGPKAVVPHELTLLERYDKAHGTELAKFLRTYLEQERSIAATARALYLHRNTVISRAAKVKDVTGADLDDPAVRLRLLVAYASRA